MTMTQHKRIRYCVLAGLFGMGCSSSSPVAEGAGGSASVGGSTEVGGAGTTIAQSGGVSTGVVGGTDTTPGVGGSSDTTSSSGGQSSVGGTQNIAVGGSGGTASTSGTTNISGNSSTGGATTASTTANTGGASITGGASSTSSVGGQAPTGGTVSTGGSVSTGGTTGTQPSVTVMKLNSLATPSWGAWQDGDGNWQQFSTATSQYTFTPTSSRYGVAIVGCIDGTVPFVNVQYRTTAVTSLNACDRVPLPPPPVSGGCGGTQTVSGKLTNVGTSGWLDVEGHAGCTSNGFGRRAVTPTAGGATYSATNTWPADFLFAIASAQGQPFTNIAVKRAVNVSTLDIDFNTDAAPAATKAFTITGLGGSDTQSHSITWQTTGSSSLFFGAATNTADSNDTYSAIDSSFVKPGDTYSFSASARQGGGTQVKTDLWGQFVTPVDLSFPVSFVSATASVAASVPYGRVQVDIDEYPGAQLYSMEATGQVVNGKPTVEWWVTATPDWFTGAGPHRVAMPNLDSASGWDDGKGFIQGSRATIVAFTSIQSPLSDGSKTIVGQQNGLFAIPSLSRVLASANVAPRRGMGQPRF